MATLLFCLFCSVLFCFGIGANWQSIRIMFQVTVISSFKIKKNSLPYPPLLSFLWGCQQSPFPPPLLMIAAFVIRQIPSHAGKKIKRNIFHILLGNSRLQQRAMKITSKRRYLLKVTERKRSRAGFFPDLIWRLTAGLCKPFALTVLQ